MSSGAGAFSLGRESAADGSFQRQASRFRHWVTDDGSTPFAPESDRYVLYVCRACPWAHRTLIGRALMGLERAIPIALVDPIRDSRGWHFSGGEYTDPTNGFEFLNEAYLATDPTFDERASVPVLWDTQTQAVVNNESADILRMLSTVFAPLAQHPVTLVPLHLRDEIDALNAEIHTGVNNAVYAAGFATDQAVYEREVRRLFESLDQLDKRLADRRFLFGAQPLETDWRLFTTLARFDVAYNIIFKCSIRKLTEYTNLWPYTRDLYQWPGVGGTVDFDDIRLGYYRSHPMINPNDIVAVLPAGDFEQAPGRA